MTGSVLAVAFITVLGGLRVVDGFSASLADVERLSQVRNLQNLLSREVSSLDIFQRSGDPREWARLRSFHEVSAIRFRELVASESVRSGGVRSIAEDHASFKSFLVRRPDRKAAEFLAKRLGDIVIKVNDMELALAEDVGRKQGALRALVFQGARFLFGFLSWELVLGFLFALGTFRSMHRALNGLQSGTEAFGQGRFDHRIPVSSSDELGDLAKSFNEMAENIKHLEVKTVHMHRMSAVGQLAGGVAHEINNPLTGVLGQAQVLLEKLPEGDPRRAHAEKIERAALRCRRIVRSLLDFSRQKETHFAVYDLHEAVDATLELCEPDFHGRRVTLLKNFSTLIPPMTGNVAQLQQVFLNLASNAIHAMSNGGALTITTALAAYVPPGGGEKADGVEVSFQDTGVGIDPDHLPHVFEPFFTTKEIGKGTGLGLSVSLGIVRNHGGDIQVESEGKGKGALFRVFLPLTPPAHIVPPPEPPPSPGARFNP
jgi:signal transduction histidine kinase